jgi:hypothetical protein
MKISRPLLILAALMTVAPRSGSASETSPADIDVLYRQAVMAETGERDMERALSLYKTVIQQAGENSLLGATSQARIAVCYERLGRRDEALQAYENVLLHSKGLPPEMVQDTRNNAERLRRENDMARAHAEAEAIRRPAYRRWVLDLEAGSAIRQRFDGYFDLGRRHDAAWAALGYRLSRYLQIGLEGGRLFNVEKTHVDVYREGDYIGIRRTQHSGYFVGPYVQGRFDRRPWGVSGRLGVGMTGSSERNDYSTHAASPTPCLGACDDIQWNRYQRLSPSLTLALTTEWHITPWISLGMGIRDLMIVTYQGTFHLTGAAYDEGGFRQIETKDQLRLLHMVMPFIRLSIKV